MKNACLAVLVLLMAACGQDGIEVTTNRTSQAAQHPRAKKAAQLFRIAAQCPGGKCANVARKLMSKPRFAETKAARVNRLMGKLLDDYARVVSRLSPPPTREEVGKWLQRAKTQEREASEGVVLPMLKREHVERLQRAKHTNL